MTLKGGQAAADFRDIRITLPVPLLLIGLRAYLSSVAFASPFQLW